MKKWRFDFRIWHWLHAFVVLGLIGTVLLRKSFLSWRTNSEILANKLLEIDLDMELTAQQSKILAKSLVSNMWEWHVFLGYAFAFLILWRILLFFTKSGRESYQNFKDKSIHKKMVTIGYIGIYGILIFMAITGLVIHFHEALGIIKETTEDIAEAHEFAFLGVAIFVPLHIIGVVIAEITDEKGIISDMVNGGEKEGL